MTYRAQIGTDTSLDTAEGGNAVMIQSHNGSVFITGPFEGWMGSTTTWAAGSNPREGFS